MEFKDRLRQLRKERKMTQGELAEHLDYGYTAISNYESGRNEPHVREFNILADLFGVTVDYLVGRTDIKPISNNIPNDCKDCIKCEVCYLGTGNIGCPYFIKKGGFIELPCKANDVIYEIVLGQIENRTVSGFAGDEDIEFIYTVFQYDGKGYTQTLDIADFGKTIFLTKEEAEKALQESKGGENNA